LNFNPLKTLKTGACVLAVSLLGVAVATGQAPVTSAHSAVLSGARVDVLADGRVAVTMDAEGDLAGSVTLMLTPKSDGTYGGEWAFTIAHVDNTDPETGVEPENAEAPHHHAADEPHAFDSPDAPPLPHRDFVRMVRRGTMNGAIDSATLSFGPDGLAALTASIAIAQGTVEFAGATGTGVATLSSLTLVY
jgi:hypothetical protein